MTRLIMCCLLGLGALPAGVSTACGQAGPVRKIDSLRQRLRQLAATDQQRVQTLVNLSNQLSAAQPREALAAARQAAQLASELGSPVAQAPARFELGLRMYELGKLDSASLLFRQALAAYRRFPPADSVRALRGSIRVQNAWAAVQASQAHFNEALRLFIANLRIAERLGDQQMQLRSLANMGALAEQTLDTERALAYYRQLLARADSVKNEREYETTLCNMAGIHSDLHHYELATRYAQRALRLVAGSGDQQNRATMLLVLGQVAQSHHEFGPAQDYAEQVLALGQQLTNPMLTGRARLQLGQLANQRRQPEQARRYLEQALPQLLETGLFENIRDTYRELATAYAQLGRFDQAYRLQQKQLAFSDSLASEKVRSDTRILQNRFEAGQKDARNRVLAAELATQQQVSRRRNVLLWSSLAIAALLAGASYLLLTRRRLRREVEFTQERQQLERLRAAAVLEAEETERRRIGADLHDGIGQLLTAARLNLDALGEQLPLATEGQRALLGTARQVVDESFREVRSISHNLMPNALMKRGLSQAVRDFLNQLAPDGHLRVEVQVVGLDQGPRLPPTVESVLFRVIQELVQNIVKHAQATEITLQLIRGDDDLTVMVEDNGVGFDSAALGPGAGIGLRNVETRMAYLGGRADFDTAPGRGTIVTLEVPLVG